MDETALRFEDLSIDDSLAPLPRFLEYAQSQIALQRLVHVKQVRGSVLLKRDNPENAQNDSSKTNLVPFPLLCILPSYPSIIHRSIFTLLQLSDITLNVSWSELGPVLEVVKKLETDEEYVVRQHLAEQIVKVGLFALVKCKLEDEEDAPNPLKPGYIEGLLKKEKEVRRSESRGNELRKHVFVKLMSGALISAINVFAANVGSTNAANTTSYSTLSSQLKLYELPPYRSLILETCVPLLKRMLSDSSPEVRATASESLTMLPPHIAPSDLGPHILTLILSLSHSDDNEELRMTGCGLLGKMAKGVGRDLCRQFVVPEVVSLAEDPVFRVRKSAALNLASICEVAGEEDTKSRLLPAYVRLTKDDMYRVRKACAESIVQVSNVLPPPTRKREVRVCKSRSDALKRSVFKCINV